MVMVNGEDDSGCVRSAEEKVLDEGWAGRKRAFGTFLGRPVRFFLLHNFFLSSTSSSIVSTHPTSWAQLKEALPASQD